MISDSCLLFYRTIQIRASNERKVLKMNSKDMEERHHLINYRIIAAFYRGNEENIAYFQSG